VKGLFGGIVIAEAYFPGLRRICLAFNLMEESLSQQRSFDVELMSENHDPDDPRRVWWHRRRPNGHEYWISINPGEFRTDPPDPSDLVRELETGTPRQTLRSQLEKAIDSCEMLRPATEEEEQTLSRAKKLLARKGTGIPQALCDALLSAPETMDQDAYQKFVFKLYDDFFDNYGATTVDFGLLLLLFQIQRVTAKRIEEDWTKAPAGFLKAFIRSLLADAAHRERNLGLLAEICDSTYELAGDYLTKGLEGPMRGFDGRLMHAHHHFSNSHFLLQSLLDADVPVDRLPFMPILAEEGFVCTWTGIYMGPGFCTTPPEADPLRLSLNAGSSWHDARRQARKNASMIVPIVTRFMAEILAAQALTQTDRPESVTKGIAELNRLNAEAGLDFSFERAWIEQALLPAYRRIKDEEAVKRMALRIAGRLVLRKNLS